MRGMMQDWPLLLHKIIDHAAIQHGDRAVVSRAVDGSLHRTTYRAINARARQVAKRLAADGIGVGDRVATLAWNTGRHVEVWYGVSGLGAICHTVNPRLYPDQVAWIIAHAGDRLVFLDPGFVPLVETLADRLPSVERFVLLTDAARMTPTTLRNAVAFEEWLAEADDDFAWPALDENTAAALCYTSGTTGLPHGVLYSHRSNVLHAMSACAATGMGYTAEDRFLVVVPMFHANAWAKIYSLPMAGATMVLPGPRLDGPSLFDLMDDEGVTMSAGVPTVWAALIDTMRQRGRKPHALRRVAIGGSACSRAMIEAFENEFGIDVYHAWGMTEMSPLGTQGSLKPQQRQAGAIAATKSKQGSAPFGVEMILVNDAGRTLPWDGVTFGRLKVRGPAVAARYYGEDGSALDADGFFETGDIATIDADGAVHIVDRAKDLIKSGGEWISSIDIENVAVAHPDVAEAAVIGIAHPRWMERPLLVVVAAPGREPDGETLKSFIRARVASWWVPDDVRVVASLPHTAAGKLNKVALRHLFADHQWPARTTSPAPE